MGTMALRCVIRHFDAVPATTPTGLARPVNSFLNDGRRDGHERSLIAPIDKPTPGLTFRGHPSRSARTARFVPRLSPQWHRPNETRWGLMLHRGTPGVAEIRSVLDTLGIEAEMVESGRRERGETGDSGQMTHHFTGGAERC